MATKTFLIADNHKFEAAERVRDAQLARQYWGLQ